MLDYEAALSGLLAALSPTDKTLELPLHGAQGQVCAQSLRARLDAPAFDNSAMDGYAVAFLEESPLDSFEQVGKVFAGEAAAFSLKAGQAVRIFTGAPLPKGTTAVISQENLQSQVENTLIFSECPKIGQHIRRKGESLQVGQVLVEAGMRLTPAALGLLASQGIDRVRVYAPLKVGIVSNGQEVHEPSETLFPEKGGIYDANRYQLMGFLAHLGLEVCDGGIMPDHPTTIREKIQQLIEVEQVDVLISSGGVSVGEADYLKAILEELGTLEAWKIAIKPGKPFAWGRIQNTTVFMLPGNPVATFVTFKQLVEPALKCLRGEKEVKSAFFWAKAGWSTPKTGGRREFLRGQYVQEKEGTIFAYPFEKQGSADILPCVHAQCLIECPPHQTIKEGGSLVKVYPL